jgi:nitrate/nitrite transporter NarK
VVVLFNKRVNLQRQKLEQLKNKKYTWLWASILLVIFGGYIYLSVFRQPACKNEAYEDANSKYEMIVTGNESNALITQRATLWNKDYDRVLNECMTRLY